jgi:hypothetical protein
MKTKSPQKSKSASETLATLRAFTKTARLAKSKSDAVKKKRLAELVALIRRRKDDVVDAFYDIGEALREIVTRKLFVAGGYGSIGAFLKAQALMSRTQAFKLIKVVDSIPRSRAMKLGQERAFALVAYAEATPEKDSPESLVSDKAQLGGKPVTVVPVREIRAATEKLNAAKHKAKRTPAQLKQHKQMDALTDGLRAALKTLGLLRLHLEQHEDSVTVRFSQEQLRMLAKRKRSPR